MLITIPIPENAKCLLKSGQTVDIGDPFLQYTSSSSVSILLAKKLNIAPQQIFKYVKKFVGEPIQKGEVLAVKRGIFSTAKILSEYEGTVKEIDHNEGICIIDIENGQKNQINTYFKGDIENIHKNELIIKVKSGKEYDLKSASHDFGGKTVYITEKDDNKISSDCDQAVCITEKISTYIQAKVEALGIAGFVTLNQLPTATNLPTAIVKNIADINKIMDGICPFCLINKKRGAIIFYT